MLLKLINEKLTNKIIAKSMMAIQEPLTIPNSNYNFMDTVFTEIAELCYNKEKSLLHIKILEDVSITVEKAKSLTDSIRKITNGQKHFTLVDATNYFFVEDEALQYMAMHEASAGKMGSAYFSTNLANRLTMHFFKVFHKPSYPVQLFRRQDEAMSWLNLIQKSALQLN
jgi:hypothetical protein